MFHYLRSSNAVSQDGVVLLNLFNFSDIRGVAVPLVFIWDDELLRKAGTDPMLEVVLIYGAFLLCELGGVDLARDLGARLVELGLGDLVVGASIVLTACRVVETTIGYWNPLLHLFAKLVEVTGTGVQKD
jgi:hypothetical protein